MNSDKIAHYEPPRLNKCCLQSQLFPFSGAALKCYIFNIEQGPVVQN